jgi:heterodisulfide reductase subunit C
LKGLKTEIEGLVQENNLYLCLECGKCSAVCPMLDFYGEYVYDRSPRGVVERLSFDPEKIDDEALWYCLACKECTFFCPCGINFQNFMMALRGVLLQHGYDKHAIFCPVCGSYIMPKKEFEHLQKGESAEKIGELLSVCERCKKSSYVDIVYKVCSGHKG